MPIWWTKITGSKKACAESFHVEIKEAQISVLNQLISFFFLFVIYVKMNITASFFYIISQDEEHIKQYAQEAVADSMIYETDIPNMFTVSSQKNISQFCSQLRASGLKEVITWPWEDIPT